MRREIAVAVGVVAILIGAGAGYFAGSADVRTVTSVSTTTINISEQAPNFSYVTTSFVCQTNFHYVPCIGFPAYIFNSCPNYVSGPQAPYTCTYTLTLSNPTPPHPSYSVNITLGLRGQSGEPWWANCSVSGGIGYADCIQVINSTAFVVGVPAPLPQ